jgi:phospho-N-acetylmuramoyl-pentapeptide-transferase
METIALFAILRMLFLAVLAFALAMAWTPLLTWLLYRFGLGKRIRNTGATPVYSALHAAKDGTPTMGGLLIWVTTLLLTLFFWSLGELAPRSFASLNFLSRSQTWLPLAALVAAAVVGLFDDLLNVWNVGASSGGLRLRHRLVLYAAIAAVGAWWFYGKLGWDTLHVPLVGDVVIGWWYVPVFFLVIVATAFSVNEIDGLDGLAGGVLLVTLGAYGVISFAQGRYDLSALTAVIMGSLLAFLWFNIYPARFFMGDTGAMSLGVVLGVLAMLTNTSLLLPIIAFPLVLDSASVIVQVASRRLFGRRVFLSAPLHHHLEASGWPEPKVVMRFWVVSGVMAALGLALFLIDRVLA